MAHTRVSTRGKRTLLTVLNTLAGVAYRLKPRSANNSGDVVRSILVVELWNIGDVVLTMPFLAQLRARFPEARIAMLCRPHAKEVLDGTGLVDEFIYDPTARGNWLSLNPRYGGAALWRVCRRLRRKNFDLAFQSRLHVREHVILALSGAQRRIGYTFGVRDRMLTDALEVDDLDRHKAADWLRLLDVVGGTVATSPPRLHVTDAERSWAARFLRERGITPAHHIVGVHPGASLPEKRWPLKRFVELARALARRSDVGVVAFVDPSGYGADLEAEVGVITAKVGLRQLIALLEQCDVLVCNDSGPMHLAGALGTPTVAAFGSGIAQWFAPLGTGHEIVVADDGAEATGVNGDFPERGSLGTIPSSKVLAAVQRIIDRGGIKRIHDTQRTSALPPGAR